MLNIGPLTQGLYSGILFSRDEFFGFSGEVRTMAQEVRERVLFDSDESLDEVGLMALADGLEESGVPLNLVRAEMIRVQLSLRDNSISEGRRELLSCRLAELHKDPGILAEIVDKTRTLYSKTGGNEGSPPIVVRPHFGFATHFVQLATGEPGFFLPAAQHFGKIVENYTARVSNDHGGGEQNPTAEEVHRALHSLAAIGRDGVPAIFKVMDLVLCPKVSNELRHEGQDILLKMESPLRGVIGWFHERISDDQKTGIFPEYVLGNFLRARLIENPNERRDLSEFWEDALKVRNYRVILAIGTLLSESDWDDSRSSDFREFATGCLYRAFDIVDADNINLLRQQRWLLPLKIFSAVGANGNIERDATKLWQIVRAASNSGASDSAMNPKSTGFGEQDLPCCFAALKQLKWFSNETYGLWRDLLKDLLENKTLRAMPQHKELLGDLLSFLSTIGGRATEDFFEKLLTYCRKGFSGRTLVIAALVKIAPREEAQREELVKYLSDLAIKRNAQVDENCAAILALGQLPEAPKVAESLIPMIIRSFLSYPTDHGKKLANAIRLFGNDARRFVEGALEKATEGSVLWQLLRESLPENK